MHQDAEQAQLSAGTQPNELPYQNERADSCMGFLGRYLNIGLSSQ
jgi:hypothetical protein